MGVSSGIDLSRRSFPPSTGLSEALGSTGLSVLASQVFSSPNSGYPSGLRLNAALDENNAGRFTLVSGVTLAGSTSATALKQLDRVQDILDRIEQRIAMFHNGTYTDAEIDRQRLLMTFDIEDLDKEIQAAGIDDYNLLDATDAAGVRLRISTGEFSNIQTTAIENIAGVDQNFAYDSDVLFYQTTDIRSAFEEFRNLELLTFTGTELATTSADNADLLTLSRFQSVIDNARENLTSFKRKITQLVNEQITVSTEPGNVTINDGFDARQAASRLAQQFSNDSYNITANPALKYFSLFS